MKTSYTLRKYARVFSFFFLSLFALQLFAQNNKCGFTSKITNGSVINLCTGSSITLNATPTGSYTYRWQRQTSAGGPFADIPGATSAGYGTNALGAYRVLVTSGGCTDTSGITNLVHYDAQGGTITGGTTGFICPAVNGGLLTGSAVPGADIGVITYQWETNINNTGWTVINGVTDANYSVAFISQLTQFRRVSLDNCGNKAYSNVITFTPTPELKAGTISPLSQTINAGTSAATINSTTPATGGSGTLRYQWRSSLFERGPYTDIPGATSANYSPGALAQTTYFVRAIIDETCQTSAITENAAVVNVVGGILNAGYFTSNSSCFFPGQQAAPLETGAPPTGGTPPYTVEWQSSTDNVNWTPIPGATGSVYAPGFLTQSTYFRKKVTDAANRVAYSPVEKISKIETTLTGGTIKPTSAVACLGSSPAPIVSTSSPTGYGEKLEYQWQYRTDVSGPWIDIPNAIREGFTPEPITVKTYFRRLAVDACGTNKRTVPSNQIEIETRPALLAGDIQPASQITFTGGKPKELTSVASPSGGTGSYTIWWENGSLAVGPWTTIAGASALSYQPPVLSETGYYRRVVKDNNCLAVKYSYVVEVVVNKSAPIVGGVLAGSTCVFPGYRPGTISTSHIQAVSGGVQPYSFQWEMRTGFTGPFVAIPGATTEAYQPQPITATSQYRRLVTDAVGASAYSDTITIEYHTAPLDPGTIAATTSQFICDGTAPGIIVSTRSMMGFGEAARYVWQKRTESGAWTDIPNAIRENYTPSAITERTYFRRWAFDMCSGVTRSAVSNEVMFDIAPKVTLKGGLVDGPFITCAGTAPGMIKSVLEACGTGAVKYQWEVNEGSGWSVIGGATGASYTPGAINGDTRFRRKVVDACGSVGYSNEVLIYVYPPIEPGVIGSPSQLVCKNAKPGKIALLTNCHYTDGTVTYQWQSSTDPNGTWVNIGGATSASYEPGAATANTYYRLKVSSTTCSMFAYTNVASVMIDPTCPVTIDPITPSVSRLLQNFQTFKVYPNPVTGNVFKVTAQTKGKVAATLQSTDGQPVPVTIARSGNNQLDVKLPAKLSQGTYILQVFDEVNRWTEKIVVQQ